MILTLEINQQHLPRVYPDQSDWREKIKKKDGLVVEIPTPCPCPAPSTCPAFGNVNIEEQPNFTYIRPSVHAACTYQYLQHDSKPHIHTRQTKSTFLVNTTYVGWMQLLKAIRCWSFQMKFNWRIFSCCIPKMWHGLRHIPLPHSHWPLFTILAWQNHGYP